ncbi:MAG: sterol desaturase family protein [Rhodoferax sp.]
MEWLSQSFDTAQGALFEALVQPAAFALGLGNLLPEAYEATGWLLVGLVQIGILLGVITPLQRWRPVESPAPWSALRVDVLYTLIHRLGLFRLALFFALDPLFNATAGWLRTMGWQPMQLDALWPGVTDTPWVSFALYLVVLDAVNYAIHRAQHSWNWWWQLHALHHAQRHVTAWSDNRNHLLDDVLRALIFAALAQAIGIAPGQYMALVALTQLLENLQHANLRLDFGRWGERLLISPRFHRRHHAIGLGHESRPGARLGGHNFGVLFPWWDMLLGSADFSPGYAPTGVRDQVEQGRNYGQGFWAQQWLGVLRLLGKA